MTSIFTADASTQGTGGFTNTKTFNTKDNPNMRLFSKSGIYNSADNEIKIFTNNIDALTIDANQKVTCDGSLITNLTWNDISGKPTNFQSDWNSTIINKPSLFDGTWTSLSGKPTNFQSDWNSTIINKPTLFDGTWNSLSGKPTNFQSDWSSTVINRPNELLNISNIIVTSNVIQNSTNLISYNNLTNKPTNFQADWLTTVINRPNELLNISNIFVTSNIIKNSYGLVNYNNLNNQPWTFSGISCYTNFYVGINTPSPSPSYNLDVNGAINSTNYFKLGLNLSNLFVTSNVLQNSSGLINYNNLTGTPIVFTKTETSNIFVTSNVLQNSSGLINYNNLTNTPNLTLKQDVISVSNPLTKTGNTIGLSYDSTLTLNGTQLSVASGTLNQWTLSGTNIYNNNTGNVGINTTAPVSRFTIRGDYSTLDNNFCLDASDGTVNNKYNFKVYPYVIAGGQVGYKFRVVSNTTNINDALTFSDVGKVCIGNVTPSQVLQVGNAGRLRIANDITDYSLIGTIDSDGSTNTRIVISGRDRGGVNANGNIEYVSTGTAGNHIFYTTDSTTERMRIANNGFTTITHTSTSTAGNAGGLYVYNPNNVANNSSIINVRIAGSTANKCGYSWDVNGVYGWSAYLTGSDTTNKTLKFNSSWDTSGSDRLILYNNGNVNIPTALSVGTTRQPLATLDVLGTIASINSATWDHIRMWQDGATAYIDCGGSESGFAIRIDSSASGYPASSYPERMRITANGTVGINNSAPVDIGYGSMLHVGRCGGGYYNQGNLTLAQDFNNGSVRQMRIGYDGLFNMSLGDWGGTNANNTWIKSFFIAYSAPASSIVVASSGYVTMSFGYGTSDQRIKTDIKTIENALFKVLNLRGIQYTDIREGCKHIGLIAQEVEGVIPEAVTENHETGIKAVAYGNMAGLFVNAFKEMNEIILNQQKTIIRLSETINNLINRIERLERLNGYQ